MDLSRKVSPIWATVSISGFVGIIGIAVALSQRYEHEPVVSILDGASSSTATIPQAAGIENSATSLSHSYQNEAGTNATASWAAVYNADIDEACGGIKDYSIGHLKRATNSVLEKDGGEREAFESWVSGYTSLSYLRSKFGQNIEPCVHPTLYSDANVASYKRQAFDYLNIDSSKLNDANISIEDRYASWERLKKLIFSTIGKTKVGALIQSKDLLNHMGMDEQSFFALGQQLGRPIIDGLIKDVSAEISKPRTSFTNEQVEQLFKKITRAQDISALTGMGDERVHNLRSAIQNWNDTVQTLNRAVAPS